MLWFLRFLFIGIIVAMLGATVSASFAQPLGEFARGPVIRDPWVVATLADAYFAFLTFYVWMVWKERRLAAAVLWFPAVMLLGNFAMSAYMLRELFAVQPGEPLQQVFTRRNEGRLILPGALTTVAVGVYLLA